MSACHENPDKQSNLGAISSYRILCSSKITTLNPNKVGSAQYYNTQPICQGKPGSYTIGLSWGVCQNWVVLSYVGDYGFGSLSSTRLTVINKINYFKTPTTSDRQIVFLIQDNHV